MAHAFEGGLGLIPLIQMNAESVGNFFFSPARLALKKPVMIQPLRRLASLIPLGAALLLSSCATTDYEDRWDDFEDRMEARWDEREDRWDDYQARREDRLEDYQDRQEDRWEDYEDRREDRRDRRRDRWD